MNNGFKEVKGSKFEIGLEINKIEIIKNFLSTRFYKYGWRKIETPILNEKKFFNFGNLEDGLYVFEDKSKRKIFLRPEFTKQIAKFYLNNETEFGKYKKYFYFGKCFRYEKPQKLRKREFQQFGGEIISNKKLNIFSIFSYFLILINFIIFKKGKFYINDLDILKEKIIVSFGEKNLKKILKKLDSGEDKEEIKKKLGKIEPSEEIKKILIFLKKFDKKFILEFNPYLSRGLDYYKGIIFEYSIENFQILGGGEYSFEDNNRKINGFGFSFGLERLSNFFNIEKEKIIPKLIGIVDGNFFLQTNFNEKEEIEKKLNFFEKNSKFILEFINEKNIEIKNFNRYMEYDYFWIVKKNKFFENFKGNFKEINWKGIVSKFSKDSITP